MGIVTIIAATGTITIAAMGTIIIGDTIITTAATATEHHTGQPRGGELRPGAGYWPNSLDAQLPHGLGARTSSGGLRSNIAEAINAAHARVEAAKREGARYAVEWGCA